MPPSQRSSARAASARASPTASSAARAALSASASSVSACASRSAAARRAAVAVSISPISAWRWPANFSGAFVSSVRSRRASSDTLADGGDLRRGAVLALAPGRALGGDRLQAAIRKLGLARDRLRLDPHFGERGAVARNRLVDLGELRFKIGGRRRARPAPPRVSPRAAFASSRPALIRCLASLSAEMRAALRPISRSAAACSSRAVSVKRCASRQRARALVSAAAAAATAASAASTALRFASTSPRAAASSPSIACRRPRSASRRAAPVGACAAAAKPSQRQKSPSRDTSRWPGLSSAARRGPSARSTTPICASRRASSGGALHDGARARSTPSGKLRIGRIERRAGPAHRRRLVDRRIEIVAERGAQRLLVALVDDQRVHHRRPQIFVLDREQLADGLRLGLEPLHAALGGGERRARGVELLARAGVRDFRGARGALGFGERRLRGGERVASAPAESGAPLPVAARPASMLASSASSRAARSRMIAQRRLQLIAPRASDRRARRSVRQRIFPTRRARRRPRRRGR